MSKLANRLNTTKSRVAEIAPNLLDEIRQLIEKEKGRTRKVMLTDSEYEMVKMMRGAKPPVQWPEIAAFAKKHKWGITNRCGILSRYNERRKGEGK